MTGKKKKKTWHPSALSEVLFGGQFVAYLIQLMLACGLEGERRQASGLEVR